MKNRGLYKLVVTCGRFKNVLTVGTKEKLIECCERAGWQYTDKDGLVWDMDIEEMYPEDAEW